MAEVVCPLLQLYEYAGVPPPEETETVAVPPLHKIADCAVEDASAAGSVTVMELVLVHPLASVIVMV